MQKDKACCRLSNLDRESNQSIQKGFSVADLISDLKEHLGYIVSAESGHGKSFLAFSLVREAIKPEHKIRTLVFTPSTVWNRRFGYGIFLVKVGVAEFSPIFDYDKVHVEGIPHNGNGFILNTDKKYAFKKSAWLEQLLADDTKNLILEIHYLNSRKIRFFTNECLKLVYQRMIEKLEQNPDYDNHILFVLEECQNQYGTYSLNDDASLEMLTVLTQSRTDANCHFLAITQRLAEVSTKVTERLRLISGLQIGFNSLNRVRNQVSPELRQLVQKLKPRDWLYLNAKENPIFTVSEYRYRGKPTQLKPEIESKPELKPSRIERIKIAFKKPSKLRLFLSVLKDYLWKPSEPKKVKVIEPEPSEQVEHNSESEEKSEEHAGLLAENEDEESEALFWDEE